LPFWVKLDSFDFEQRAVRILSVLHLQSADRRHLPGRERYEILILGRLGDVLNYHIDGFFGVVLL